MDLTGEWTVTATVPGGGEYTGRISARQAGDAVALEWDITAGRYVGIGLPLGDHWYVACGDTWEGLGLALIAADGAATWTAQPPGGTVQTGSFTASGPATWVADDTFPFASVVVGGDGNVLAATLTDRHGNVSSGLALTTGKGFALAWYPTFEQTVILDYFAGEVPGTIEAVWALGGHSDLAAETLRPLADPG